MTFDEFCCVMKVEDEYSRLYDEYGDAMPNLNEYKQQRYQQYLRSCREYVASMKRSARQRIG